MPGKRSTGSSLPEVVVTGASPMSAATVARNTAIGIASGLVAAGMMNAFQNGWSAIKRSSDANAERQEREARPGGDGRKGGRQSAEDSDKDEPSTVKAADRVARKVTGEPIPSPYRKPAGKAVHYGFGALLGAVYGALGTVFPKVRSGFGSIYGMSVALTADEALVPAAGLGPPPQKVPLSTHVYGLASHLVFGAALEGNRRSIERVLKTARSTG